MDATNQDLAQAIFRIRWLPREGVYEASAVQFPGVSCTDTYSAAAAVERLKVELEQLWRAEAGDAREVS
ncbi:hypothetical protein NBRGN_074_00410 [Nocardia brasiliensis NBRC 14402]|nr:hypothetical protein CEQ30_06415 [Nocardia brasiliensis]GAJ84490.1 hypothetical protein NBRGN_074_00410 [Nocardia brasiliensis NBRC 14402]SUB47718.1 Uncharacterised protein [Nocardia brasiliensis]